MSLDHDPKSVFNDAVSLQRYLIARQPPPEKGTIEDKYSEIRERVEERGNYEVIDDAVDKKVHSQTMKLLKLKVYTWAPIQYDKYRGLMYLVTRSAPDYAVLYRVLSEIHSRDTDFRPKTLLDFGSGVGTVSW